MTEIAGSAGSEDEATGKGKEEMMSVDAVCGSVEEEGDAEKKSER